MILFYAYVSSVLSAHPPHQVGGSILLLWLYCSDGIDIETKAKRNFDPRIFSISNRIEQPYSKTSLERSGTNLTIPKLYRIKVGQIKELHRIEVGQTKVFQNLIGSKWDEPKYSKT